MVYWSFGAPGALKKRCLSQGTVPTPLGIFLEILPACLRIPVYEGVRLGQLRLSNLKLSLHLVLDLSHLLELFLRPWC